MSDIRRTPTGAPVAALAAALATGLTLGACSTLGGDERRDGTAADAQELRVVRYAVARGDRLAVIAREFTGDLALWRTIADLNGIDDPRRLAVGQILEIPLALIPETDREARLAASGPVGATGAGNADADAVAGTNEGNAATRLAELRARAAPVAPAEDAPSARPAAGAVRVAAEPVIVTPVRSREAFELSPLDGPEAAAGAGDRFVKVIGSYTPKGVYERPEGQSRVLMRITPGTVLPLERSVDGWYRVTTSAGPGFIRAEDARIVGDAAGG